MTSLFVLAGSFRCNIFQQRGSVGLVLRLIPARILSVKEPLLRCPERIAEDGSRAGPGEGTTGRANPRRWRDDRPTSTTFGTATSSPSRTDRVPPPGQKAIINQREIEVDTGVSRWRFVRVAQTLT